VIGGVAAAIVVCAAVAVAASSGGPVPKRQPLARAIHQALKAPAISGITARISFTNNLIDGSELQGSDPLLQGAAGRLWLSSARHELRLELQSSNGDAQVVVHNRSFWLYDPSSQTAYEGTLPAQRSRSGVDHRTRNEGMPSVSGIQSALDQLTRHALLSGAIPGDIAGEPAYSVRIAPRRDGGLLGAIELGWDAVRGVPLRLEVFARGDSTPVLELTATDISFGRVPASAFAISPPQGAKMVHLTGSGQSGADRQRTARSNHEVTGVAAVSRALPFRLAAPASLAGLRRNTVALVHFGSRPAALVTYGHGLGGLAVLEQASSGRLVNLSTGGGEDGQGLRLPTVSIDGSSGQELDTALGTVIRFARDHVAYTVLGSVKPAEARAAARGL
jgi:outer membrane lipoprotein-sorting protein